jgi:hypothetical protein
MEIRMKKIALATVAAAFCLATLPSMAAAPTTPKSAPATAGKTKPMACGLLLPWCPKY